MNIAIDFDGTIVFDKYPEIGELKPNVKKVIQRLRKNGHKVIINTCRTGQKETEAKCFLLAAGIRFDSFNENLPELVEFYGSDCRKISADLYIDDKSFYKTPDDWEDIWNIGRALHGF